MLLETVQCGKCCGLSSPHSIQNCWNSVFFLIYCRSEEQGVFCHRKHMNKNSRIFFFQKKRNTYIQRMYPIAYIQWKYCKQQWTWIEDTAAIFPTLTFHNWKSISFNSEGGFFFSLPSLSLFSSVSLACSVTLGKSAATNTKSA